MRTIAVVLGDNDFGNTFKPLLESLWRAIEWNDGLDETVLVDAIKSGIEFHYRAFQLGDNAGKSGYGSVADTVKYLGAANVLFDEAAEADICQAGHDGGAWYLEIASGNVRSY